MDWLPMVACGLLGGGTVFTLVPLIQRFSARARLHRVPDFHHTHLHPIPRTGGLALAAAMLALEAFLALFFPERRAPIPGRAALTLACLAMFAIGFWDDLKPLRAKPKLAAQVLVSLFVWTAGLGLESFKLPFTDRLITLGSWGAPLTVVWLVAFPNLLNLIDGVDGLAAGIALMVMTLLVYIGSQNGTFVLLSAGMVGALLSFLWFNFPPARIYLGDGGAYLLGSQIALFASAGSHKGSVFAALLAPLLVLALPITDALLAVSRRGLRGLPLFRADCRHIHHRLLAMGMSHRKVVLWLYGLTLLFLLLGFVTCCSRGEFLPLLSGGAVLAVLLCAGKLSFGKDGFDLWQTLRNSLAMRREVEYAICLAHCLRLEARRSGSALSFAELVRAAQRLGFTGVILRFSGTERKWGVPAECHCLRSFRQGFPPGSDDLLELQGPSCLSASQCKFDGGSARNHSLACPWKRNSSRFEVISELLAEGWNGAAKSAARHPPPLQASLPGPRARISQAIMKS